MIYGSLGEGEEALINKCAQIANDTDCGTEEHTRAVKVLVFYSNKIKKLRNIRKDQEDFVGNYHKIPFSKTDWRPELCSFFKKKIPVWKAIKNTFAELKP